MKANKLLITGLLTSCLLIQGSASYSDKLISYMFRTIKYQSDFEYEKGGGDGHPGSEYMQSAFETFVKKKGDCEDYANFAKYVLEKQGRKATVVSMYQRDKNTASGHKPMGHALCVYIDDDGLFGTIDTSKRVKMHERFKSLYELGDRYYGEWGLIKIVKEDPSNSFSNERDSTIIKRNQDGTPNIIFDDKSFPIEVIK